MTKTNDKKYTKTQSLGIFHELIAIEQLRIYAPRCYICTPFKFCYCILPLICNKPPPHSLLCLRNRFEAVNLQRVSYTLANFYIQWAELLKTCYLWCRMDRMVRTLFLDMNYQLFHHVFPFSPAICERKKQSFTSNEMSEKSSRWKKNELIVFKHASNSVHFDNFFSIFGLFVDSIYLSCPRNC